MLDKFRPVIVHMHKLDIPARTDMTIHDVSCISSGPKQTPDCRSLLVGPNFGGIHNKCPSLPGRSPKKIPLLIYIIYYRYEIRKMKPAIYAGLKLHHPACLVTHPDKR
jgi:hypothetical protein